MRGIGGTLVLDAWERVAPRRMRGGAARSNFQASRLARSRSTARLE